MLARIDLSMIPDNVRSVASAIRQASGRAFLVGGPVRDLMMGAEPADWDVATDLPPAEVVRIFPRAATVGIEFGRVQQSGVDVVSLRGESGYRDRRHPSSVTFGVSIEEDLRRRDFTVNAMAAEFDDLAVIDPFGGADDILARVLRAVGDARGRLSEDPLRILRAVRFKTVLGFTLDPEMAALLPGMTPLLRSISGERVYAEISRILLSGSVEQGILDLWTYGLGDVVMPEVISGSREEVARIARALSHSPRDLSTRLAILVIGGSGDHSAAARGLFERLGVPSDLRHSVLWLARNWGDEGFLRRAVRAGETDHAYIARRLLDEAGADQVIRLADVFLAIWRGAGNAGTPDESRVLAEGLEAVRSRDPASRLALPGLAVSGEDVMSTLGLQEGAHVGQALAFLKEAVLRDPGLNRKDLLLETLLRWWRSR